jgi:ABC-type spermidine/putrescine transport system permease subunit I
LIKDGSNTSAGGKMAQRLDSEARSGLTLISPTAIYAIVLLAAPMAMVVMYSFLTDGNNRIEWIPTFENYIEVWTGPVYRAIMFRSLLVSLCVTFITVLRSPITSASAWRRNARPCGCF